MAGLPWATTSLLPERCWNKLPPFAQRATWAHENAFESMILYAPAALMAYVTQQQSTLAWGL
jgi:uncharacterized MAPEG superfamily protein